MESASRSRKLPDHNTPRKQPNVIVFFTDQQRWDTMAAHGNPLGITPNLDRMALEHTFLAHSVTCQPVCGPARSCLQTGQYATQTGCVTNGYKLPHDKRSLAHYFNEAGYKTGYIGKWHLGDPRSKGAVAEEDRGGYQYWMAANALEHTSDAYDCRIYNNDNEEVKLPGYRVDALTDCAIQYVDKNKENPFFLFLSFLEPHHQNHRDDYPAPDFYREQFTGKWTPPDLASLPLYDQADNSSPTEPHLLGGSAQRDLGGYWGMVKRLDEAYGRLIDSLKSLGLFENTVILFTSDHACHFKTRNQEYKRSCHESSIRVPTVISGPGFESGGTIREIVNLVDLPATLLDAAGIAQDTMSGESILPLVQDRKNARWRDDSFIQISESCTARAVTTKRWKYCVTSQNSKPWDGKSRSDEYTETHLYDLYADPYELCNLIGYESHRGVADKMKERLLRYISDIENETPEIINAPARKSGQRIVSKEEILQ